MKPLIYQWVRYSGKYPRWMALAFVSYRRNRALFVVFPLNLLVALVWWAQDRWAQAACAPSWIDREAESRAEQFREKQF